LVFLPLLCIIALARPVDARLSFGFSDFLASYFCVKRPLIDLIDGKYQASKQIALFMFALFAGLADYGSRSRERQVSRISAALATSLIFHSALV
jgi:hypothetical protein